MIIGILDYGIGNIYSLKKFFFSKNIKFILINSPNLISKCDKIILPGQGSFNHAIENINNNNYKEAIILHIDKGKFLLGICLGMQLLMKKSHENGISDGLGIIDGEVKKINFQNNYFPLPHIGWKKISITNAIDSNINTLVQNNYYYFAHSYFCEFNEKVEKTYTNYQNFRFISLFKKENIIGSQFHPELSSAQGYKFLENFIYYE